MFERFTDRARRAVVLAQQEAVQLHHNYIGTEHVLLGLLGEGEGVAARVLVSLGMSLETTRARVEELVEAGPGPGGQVPFTPRAKKALELSLGEALQLGHDYIGTEHLLLGLIHDGEGIAAQVVAADGADLGAVREAVLDLVRHRGVAESGGPEDALSVENRRLRGMADDFRQALGKDHDEVTRSLSAENSWLEAETDRLAQLLRQQRDE
jgi:ATP-dependent Clp protease ATP-binding subunit ClpC